MAVLLGDRKSERIMVSARARRGRDICWRGKGTKF